MTGVQTCALPICRYSAGSYGNGDPAHSDPGAEKIFPCTGGCPAEYLYTVLHPGVFIDKAWKSTRTS